jgi:hypothetical protein
VNIRTLETPHLFTVEEYMSLDTDARTELLGGVVYDVAPRYEPHRYAVQVLLRALVRGLDDRYAVRAADAVAVEGWKGRDAPEIDVAVLANTFYRRGPTANDASAFIEVSDTTYATDRGYKIPLYVRAGVPSWIVNVSLRQVECYATTQDLDHPHGQVFPTSTTFEVLGVPIRVADLFRDDSGTG